MANLSSDFQTFTMDDPITQLAELSNTLHHQFQTFPPFSSPLDSLFFHHHHQYQDHFLGKSLENSFHHQGMFLPSNIHNNDESSSRFDDTKKRKSLMEAAVSTSENSVSDQTLSSSSAHQVSLNGNILTKNVF